MVELQDQRLGKRREDGVAKVADVVEGGGAQSETEPTSEHGGGEHEGPGLAKAFDRAIKALPRWIDRAPETVWEPCTEALVDAVWSAPRSPLLMKLASALGGAIALRSFPTLVSRVVSQLVSQPVVPSREDAESELFNRLAPLLLLRALPASTFEGGGSTDAVYASLERVSLDSAEGQAQPPTIVCQLLQRVGGLTEYPEVRKVAAELVGHLSPGLVLPRLLDLMGDAEVRGDLFANKVYR